MSELTNFFKDSNGDDGFFQRFGAEPWLKNKDEVLYLYREPYSDKSYTAHVFLSPDDIFCSLALIPGQPYDNGTTGPKFFRVVFFGRPKEQLKKLSLQCSAFKEASQVHMEYLHFTYHPNGEREEGLGSIPFSFGIKNYNIRKLPSELYQADLPQAINFEATVNGFIGNIMKGDFSLPELIRK